MEIWRKSVIFLISTYNKRKTRTKFANLRTPSCSAHYSGPRFVTIGKGFEEGFFFVGQCNLCNIVFSDRDNIKAIRLLNTNSYLGPDGIHP